MVDFELMRNVTIGQYLPTGSLLHRLDPRTKIVGFGVLLLLAALLRPAATVVAGLVVTLALLALARIRMGYALSGLRPALPILLILAGLQLAFGWGAVEGSACVTLLEWWIVHVTNCSMLSVIAMLARLVALLLLTSLLTLTTSVSELTHGVEALLRPFQRIGLPAHELAMVFTLALRFVPTLAEELEKMLKAQAARGADIRMGNNIISRTRQLVPVMVPLFLSTLRRSEELIEAMIARGYSGGVGRSHFIRLRPTVADLLALVVVVALAAGLLFAPFGRIDAIILLWLGGIGA
jgi:energy-coupling factor transport system permease protein